MAYFFLPDKRFRLPDPHLPNQYHSLVPDFHALHTKLELSSPADYLHLFQSPLTRFALSRVPDLHVVALRVGVSIFLIELVVKFQVEMVRLHPTSWSSDRIHM